VLDVNMLGNQCSTTNISSYSVQVKVVQAVCFKA
jgi:hypothetical protein